ncbi:hypothetical protein GUJ93_ZPchr0004g38625 [Zizania palustris]|uniref:BRX domain-containing protein n=1 Tax=Zizania palustris TaxID=103762 RepID=A0A8J5SIU3_ZIZPA|nr:hypothetical protein GUJ93_ZPchr0004g38625 [Zizania palustris]
MKAMSLKVKMGGGGNDARPRARRRGRRRQEEEDEEDLELQGKDIAAAAPSASAKIVPAQLQEADGHDGTSSGDDDHRGARTSREEGNRNTATSAAALQTTAPGRRGEAEVAMDHTMSAEEVVEESDQEWVAEPEPGVLMTLVARPDGTNHLRRIRFREELFDGTRAAQRWWADNYDSIVELYSVVQPERSHHDEDDDGDSDSVPATPCQSEDDDHRRRRQQGCDSASIFSGPSSGSGSGGGSASTVGSPILGLVTKPSSSARATQFKHSPT